MSSLFMFEEEHREHHHILQFHKLNPKKRNKRACNETSTAQASQLRRLWARNRSKEWWEKCSHIDFPDDEFKKLFHMSKATFNMICHELQPSITKKNTMLRAAIPVRERVAVCIRRLATGEPLSALSDKFGLGTSTCHKLVLEVCSAIKNTMMQRFIQWPEEARLADIKKQYETISGIPNIGGSIYTTHIPIALKEMHHVEAYLNKHHTERNQKTSYTITIQGVVDPRGIFTDVCIGRPGSLPDDKVMERSALYERANRGFLNNIWMVGNSGYPLTDWLLVPYTHQNLKWTQHIFNEKIEDIEKVAKDSFSKLKKRWGCLQKPIKVKLQELPALLGACCVLHNICEMRNDQLQIHDSFELFDDEILLENPIRSNYASQVRDQIAHTLLHHRP
ncbi:unnamed protein product [Amaranthus hypochondriacus]